MGVRPSDHIWRLVAGFAEPIRSNRLMLMLNAYIDDSNMNVPPICMLGGWVGTAKDWALFSDDWAEALWMKPRLEYFKLSEAQSLAGQFSGWSEVSRDERLRLLLKIIERHKMVGVANAIPYDAYKEVFGQIPDKGIRNPYFIAFYGIISMLAGHYQRLGHKAPIDFIFDSQPDQFDIIMGAWKHFKDIAPDLLSPLVGDYPLFRDDKMTLPLQAADLQAGWSRQLAEDHFYGRPGRATPWGIDLNIQVITRYWSKRELLELKGTLNLTGRASS